MVKTIKNKCLAIFAFIMAAPAYLAAAIDPSKATAKAGEWANFGKTIIFMFGGVVGIGMIVWGLLELYKGRQEGGDKTKAVLLLVSGAILLGLAGVLGALELGPNASDANEIDFSNFK